MPLPPAKDEFSRVLEDLIAGKGRPRLDFRLQRAQAVLALQKKSALMVRALFELLSEKGVLSVDELRRRFRR